MFKRIIVSAFLLIIFGCNTSNYAVVSTNVCQDEMYLTLKKLPLSSLTQLELHYLLEKERQCLETQKINQIGFIEQRLQSIDDYLWLQFYLGIIGGILFAIFIITK